MRAVGKILANGKLEVTLINDNGTSEVILKAGSADRKFVNVVYHCSCEGVMAQQKTIYDCRIKLQKTDWAIREEKPYYTYSSKCQNGKVETIFEIARHDNSKTPSATFGARVVKVSLPIEM